MREETVGEGEREESRGGRRVAATYVEEGYMTTPLLGLHHMRARFHR